MNKLLVLLMIFGLTTSAMASNVKEPAINVGLAEDIASLLEQGKLADATVLAEVACINTGKNKVFRGLNVLLTPIVDGVQTLDLIIICNNKAGSNE